MRPAIPFDRFRLARRRRRMMTPEELQRHTERARTPWQIVRRAVEARLLKRNPALVPPRLLHAPWEFAQGADTAAEERQPATVIFLTRWISTRKRRH
jgi:hypothetical protein